MIVDTFFPNGIFIQDSRQRVIKIEIVNRGTFYLWNERAPCVPWSLINSRTFKIQDIFSPAIDFARSYNAGALTNDPQIPYSHRRYRRGIRGNSVSVESAGLHAGIGELVIWGRGRIRAWKSDRRLIEKGARLRLRLVRWWRIINWTCEWRQFSILCRLPTRDERETHRISITESVRERSCLFHLDY